MKELTACMMRCRNEARWIRASLERTFEVAGEVVVWDDGSTDHMQDEAMAALGGDTVTVVHHGVEVITGSRGRLHWLHSPFRWKLARPREGVNEIRDKNMLWAYCKARVPFTYMLCLDGDEVLSRAAVQAFPNALQCLDSGAADILTIPFVYVWDTPNSKRVDGIYGDQPDGYPILRFPRLFSIAQLSEDDLFDSHFSWQGTKGGFHCGSIPREKLRRSDGSPFRGGFWPLPVVHYGYLDAPLRQSKYEFYNRVDPGNQFEGEYKHIIGQPNQHAPGPVQLAAWSD